MKYSEKALESLNELWILSLESKKMYLAAQNKVEDKELMVFFRVRAFESHQYANDLKLEIEKLGFTPKPSETLKSEFQSFWLNFNNLLLLKNKQALLDEVYNLKKVSVEKYNALLMEINLSLSTCKLLMKQRDSIQRTINAIERQEASVA